tara:strand:+ start:796 stop:1155 length:360 start_codon:yes stop_codon:yes gene_type:complete
MLQHFRLKASICLRILVAVGATTLGAPKVHSYEYSVRHAFCTDYARNSIIIISSSLYYDLQVAYNNCMKNADERIRQKNQRALEAQRQLNLYLEQKRKEKQQEMENIEKLTDNIEQIFR